VDGCRERAGHSHHGYATAGNVAFAAEVVI
jgi:hypothetical protein